MTVRRYRFELTTAGLVHIGNGETYGKKDYFLLDGKVAVLDVRKFVGFLSKDQMAGYCEFLEVSTKENRDATLQNYLRKNESLMTIAKKSIAYKVDTPLATARRGSIQYHDVFKFVKDSYGNPYVPGSSVKGMIRTALLTFLLLDDSERARFFDAEAARCGRGKNLDKRMMREVFWREKFGGTDSDVANDIMKYVSVSDSEPLSVNDLVFAKKYDKFSKSDDASHKLDMGNISTGAYYEGNELDVYRECLRPRTRFSVSVDIDGRIDEYLAPLVLDAEGLRSVFERSFGLYSECFLNNFDTGGGGTPSSGGASASDGDDGICRYVTASGPLAGRRCRNRAVDGTGYCNTHKDKAGADGAADSGASVTCYLGGGVDFNSKTVVNALFESQLDRVSEVSHILYSQFPSKVDFSLHPGLLNDIRREGYKPRSMGASYDGRNRLRKGKDDHRHWRDVEFGVSPHTLKMGLLGKEKHLMGKCSLDIRERS